MPPVVMRAALDLSRTHPAHGCVRSNASMWISRRDAEHDGVRRRMHVDVDDVAHLLDEQWICRQLERLGALRLQAKARQIRCTVVRPNPLAFATPRLLQCVSSRGVSSIVLTITRSIRSR